ncbi:putative RNA helicase [Heterostelium album PN500]|uniref:RNA helicase n=1 Tax=Heterostelium pallidum (strain ATCC 26659 / Pp 5 / PN500) TaxID=670386 RepID=D3B2U5_HETP5|nr:putative RNA helicase [Heterostelium album PN500]EFA83643.1 putative RNA helicase [Heterostelium album PN500]|eukprot:XP_020435760.1 putative RNA helicase [Heterostelium album PN500]
MPKPNQSFNKNNKFIKNNNNNKDRNNQFYKGKDNNDNEYENKSVKQKENNQFKKGNKFDNNKNSSFNNNKKSFLNNNKNNHHNNKKFDKNKKFIKEDDQSDDDDDDDEVEEKAEIDPLLISKETTIDEKEAEIKINLEPVIYRKQDLFYFERYFLNAPSINLTETKELIIDTDDQIITNKRNNIEEEDSDSDSDSDNSNNNKKKDEIIEEQFIIGTNIPVATSVKNSCLPQSFKTFFFVLQHSTPTKLQQYAWPCVLTGHDVLGISLPGSGKTAGFLLPMIPHCQDRIKNETIIPNSPSILILVPTRELARQIYSISSKLRKHFGIHSLPIYGGVAKEPQIQSLQGGIPHILIATPGRLVDLIDMGVLNLNGVTMLVVDEADKMLSMGLIDQLEQIKSQIRPDVQTLFFSATFPSSLQTIEATWLKQPYIRLKIGSEQLPNQSHIKQNLHYVTEFKKAKKLLKILPGLTRNNKTIIFFNQISHLRSISKRLLKINVEHQTIYGSLNQMEREKIIQTFKRQKEQRLLLATDVIGRGIHIDDLDLVLNYDLPSNLEQYCHRIGRVGRNGRKGEAISFVSRKNMQLAQDLVTLLEENNQTVPQEFKKNCNEFIGTDFTISQSNREKKKEMIKQRKEKQALKKQQQQQQQVQQNNEGEDEDEDEDDQMS